MRSSPVQYLIAILGFTIVQASEPVGTSFSYRGSLTVSGSPANGTYDLKFTLFDALTNGTPVTLPITNVALLINNDLFNVALDFGPGAFNGERRWLEIGVRTNGSPADFEPLAPRQELAPQPYALSAISAESAAVALSIAPGVLSGPFSLTNQANSFTGDGTGLAGVNATTLGGLGATSFWQVSGNAGTIAGVNFLGTTDNQPLELKVNGLRALRLEPNSSGAPNVVGGAPVNLADVGTVGAMIGGGGAMMYNGLSYTNQVASDFGTIGGGLANSIWSNSPGSTIGGGYLNLLVGTNSTIAGGCSNLVQTLNGFIGGGMQNSISGAWLPDFGRFGAIVPYGSTIAGGLQNSIVEGPSFTFGAFPAGMNIIGGGSGNYIDGDNGFPAAGDTISGGVSNSIYGSNNTISGGSSNRVDFSNGHSGNNTIGGGCGNWITGGNFRYDCTVSGGYSNIIGTYSSSIDSCTIGGGANNFVDGQAETVAGGNWNTIVDYLFSGAMSSSIGGGEANVIYPSDCATVSGGLSNSVSGDFGTIPGGQNNFASTYAFAAGYRAKATNQGAFVWAGGNTNDFPSATDNSFRAYTPGGFEVDWGGQDATGQGLKWIALASRTPGRLINAYNGAYLSTGGSWVDVSDRNAKKDFEPVNGREVLERVAKLPLATWSYRSENEQARHLGPVAQDFHAAFGLGVDDKHIAALDSSGVALAAIQGLNQKLDETVREQDAEIKELRQTVSELTKLVNTLAQKSNGGSE